MQRNISNLQVPRRSSVQSSKETTVIDEVADTILIDSIHESPSQYQIANSQLLIPPLSHHHADRNPDRRRKSSVFSIAFGTFEGKSMGRKILNQRRKRDNQETNHWWRILSRILTFYFPSPFLSLWVSNPQSQQAFREKLALCTIIAVIMGVVGLMTFGLSIIACDKSNQRFYISDQVFAKNQSPLFSVRGAVFSFHPDFPHSRLAPTLSSAVLNDSQINGNDLSFLFPPKFGPKSACSPYLDSNYTPFRCVLPGIWPTDSSSQLQACHDDPAFGNRYLLYTNYLGQLQMDFNQVASGSSLTIFNEHVLDLSRLEENPEFLGRDFYDFIKRYIGQDATYPLVKAGYTTKAHCLVEVFKVASLTSTTFGCLVSDVILLISAIIIVGIVGAKFFLALFFAYGVSWKLGRITFSSETRFPTEEDNYICIGLEDSTELNSSDSDPLKSSVTASRGIELIGAKEVPNQIRHESMKIHSSSRHPLLPLGISPSSQLALHNPTLYHTIVLIPCFSESYDSLKKTLDSVAFSDYPATHKLMFVVADGLVSGKGNGKMTHESLIDMMDIDDTFDHQDPRFGGSPPSYPYLSVADGEKCKNFAQVYAGWYRGKPNTDEEKKVSKVLELDRPVRERRGGRVPMILVVKIGNECENDRKYPTPRPGNRGKRDSQFILMNLLAKIATSERLTELEFDILHKMWTVGGVPVHDYETVLFIDADTRMCREALTKMNNCFFSDPTTIGVCGETLVDNKLASWVTAIQVYEYFINHHFHKAFESVFGSVTCLPGCGTAFRIKVQKEHGKRSILILSNPDIVHTYGQIQANSLHEKNLLLLGEDRYLTTLLLKTFPRRRLMFLPCAKFWTTVPEKFSVLLSQRRRWINSTIHNLLELILLPNLCGTFCISMHFIIFMELIGTVVLPAAVIFAIVMVVRLAIGLSVSSVSLFVLASIVGFPALFILATASSPSYLLWMMIYLISTPIWHFAIPLYAFWHFDDFSWGATRKIEGESKISHDESEGMLNLHGIYLKPWQEWMVVCNRALAERWQIR